MSLSTLFSAAAPLVAAAFLLGDPQWAVFDGKAGPGQGKHVVLVSGDEEYRSEEALPQLAKILATHHGFRCTVLFAIDPATGTINPNVVNNIPGLEALKSADLMVIATRFRNLPDEQMKHIVEYLESGRPVLGLRTATHAFNFKGESSYTKYSHSSSTKGYEKGFGRQVLGETWVAHHGGHGSQSTRGILVPEQKDHPILRGLKDGDIWGPSDVYTAHPPSDSTILVRGQVLKGMKFDDPPLEGKKNDPMMPIAWTRHYQGAEGKSGRVFTTTMGAATDFAAEGTRRLVINGAYWAVGLEDRIPAEGTKVDVVGTFQPTPFGNNRFAKDVRPVDLQK